MRFSGKTVPPNPKSNMLIFFFFHSLDIFEEVIYTRYYVCVDTHMLIHLNTDQSSV